MHGSVPFTILKICYFPLWLWVYSRLLNAKSLPPLIPAVHSFSPSTNDNDFHLASRFRIVVDASQASARSENDTTLIPPTLRGFGETFLSDLQELFDSNVNIEEIDLPPNFVPENGDIILTLLPSSIAQTYTLAKGTPTVEGYEMVVTSSSVKISGSGPKGAFWATRTLLQGLILANKTFPSGTIKDQPDWSTRGFMLDVGRKFYPIEYLTEMCAYASFFKTSEFHVHLSDNISPNGDFNAYARFRLRSEFEGLTPHENETYSQEEFETFQQSCALRGVTVYHSLQMARQVIPELEAPGHALVINQWKPELALSTDITLLNLSYPDTLPTIKTIWEEFLPWMHTKQVSIGADEYDMNLADNYNEYVDTMDALIGQAGKTIRIWGTNEPSNKTSVNKNVIIQHWEFFEDDPFQLIQQGYRVINRAGPILRCSMKRVSGMVRMQIQVEFGIPPSSTEATWNDNGPTASTPLEAFYAIKRGLPITVSAGWQAGSSSRPNHLTEEQYNLGFPILQAFIPGQNLDRRVPSKTPLIVSYDFSNPGQTKNVILDKSGNGYDGRVVQQGIIETSLTSKGLNYTVLLQLQILPSLVQEGNILTGPDDTFGIIQNGEGDLTFAFNSTNITYPFPNYTLQLGESNAQSNSTNEGIAYEIILMGTEEGTSAYINGEFVGSFVVSIPASFSPVHMSFVAPLQSVRYDIPNDGLRVEKFMVWDGIQDISMIAGFNLD
ncbi:hypothetical protein Clacol_003057 [Clathrus columnatus]|uniref:beta-N-acetylhexosaminidase n=1 Tax=Clathrus columnatus TaxID=1419009 RepID=A0AAV5A5T9_9AGAM|nr:hypothetical protein Clacol_003057 [Clathrus columnatus]